MNQELHDFLKDVVLRGLSVDLERGFSHKEHESSPRLPRAPIKINLCTGELREDGNMTEHDMIMLGHLLYRKARKEHLTMPAIAGAPRVGEGIARRLQYAVRHEHGQFLHMVSLEKEESLPGKVLPSKDYPPGQVVLPIDDVANRGATKLRMVERLREAGYIVTDFLVFLNYEQGAREALKKLGVELHAVATVSQLLDTALHMGRLSPGALVTVRQYLNKNRSPALT